VTRLKRLISILLLVFLAFSLLMSIPLVQASPAYEDFTTYTEEDPNSHITKNSSRVTFSNLTRPESAYVYKDFGSGYFSGDFEFKLDVRYTTCGFNGFVHVWGLFNAVGDRDDACGSPKNYIGVYFGGEGFNDARIVIAGFYDGVSPSSVHLQYLSNLCG